MLVVYLSTIGENKPKGDKFVWIYENYRGHMMKAAYMVCKDMYISEDAVHETFMRIIKYMDRIDENDYEGNLGFLSIMKKNITRNLCRKNKRMESWDVDDMDLVDVGCNVEAEVIEKEMDREMLEILRKLPKKAFDVIWLYYVKHFNTTEIAEMLDMKVDSIKKRLLRGRRELYFYLRGMNDEKK